MDQIYIDEFQSDFGDSDIVQSTGDANSRPDAISPNLPSVALSPITGRTHSAWVDSESVRIIIGVSDESCSTWESTYEAQNIPVAHTGSSCIRHLTIVVDSSGNNAVTYEFHDSEQVELWIYDERLIDGVLTGEATYACLGSSPAMMSDKELDILCFYRAADGRICWRSRANPSGAAWGTEYEVDIQGITGDLYPVGAFLVGGMEDWEQCKVVLVAASHDAVTGTYSFNYIESAGYPLSIIPRETTIIDVVISSIDWAVSYEQQPEENISVDSVINGIQWDLAYIPNVEDAAIIGTAITSIAWTVTYLSIPAENAAINTEIKEIIWTPVNTNQQAMSLTAETTIMSITWE
jgi:hypothetical protein